MFRSFIALTLTAALAVTGFTAPAKAGNDDLTKALIGLAVIAGVAVAIDNRNDRRDARRAVRTQLPQQCLRRFNTGRQIQYGFGIGCLNNNAPQVTTPEHCARRGRNPRGNWTTFFPENCMVRDGYTVVRN